MLIQWLGHACFKITAEDESLVIDPFEDGSVPGYRPVRESANMVLCSHQHHDHNAVGCIRLLPAGRAFEVEKLESFHDDQMGAQRGPNTIHVITAEGYRVAHLGDLGCDLTFEQAEELRDLDVLMIPVGGYFTIDALQAARIVKQLRPRITIPMHYHEGDLGYEVLGSVQEFTDRFEKVIWLTSDTLELSDELQDEIIVLDYPQNIH
ncbi:MAG: MBL fold metallo-hydrolase [Erysipelotrichaceae bacterium]|nr:MBL fold metallo-hydrolase [Erysipelotrichaceae bacterium]